MIKPSLWEARFSGMKNNQIHLGQFGYGTLFLLSVLMFACHRDMQLSQLPIRPSHQETIAYYLNIPYLVHDSFASEVIPTFARFQKYHKGDDMLYFSMPLGSQHAERMRELVTDTTCIEYGKALGNGYVKLGPAYLYNKDRRLFRFPVDQLQLDNELMFRRDYGEIHYELSIDEMRTFHASANLYNGPALFTSDTSKQEIRLIANHSAPIALKGIANLEALVAQLIDPTDSPESQAQQLLDFVTKHIAYEYHYSEIFMKPHEVLLSGKTDCSGKVVLYSSLLNQLGIAHLLIYQDDHICVALPGTFPNDNGMRFLHEGISHQIAETTVPRFEIGKTELESPILLETVEHIQRPGFKTKLFDVHTGDSLDFAVRYVSVPQ